MFVISRVYIWKPGLWVPSVSIISKSGFNLQTTTLQWAFGHTFKGIDFGVGAGKRSKGRRYFFEILSSLKRLADCNSLYAKLQDAGLYLVIHLEAPFKFRPKKESIILDHWTKCKLSSFNIWKLLDLGAHWMCYIPL